MNVEALAVSLKLAACTTALMLPLGIAGSRALAWRRFRGKALVEAAIALPLVLPPTVLGYYLLVSLSPATGLGKAFESLTASTLAFSFTGLVLASMVFNLPFVIQPMQQGFAAVSRDLREAAWVSGLSPWRTFVKVELPLAWPGVLAAMVLTFAHTLGEFGVVLMVGGNIPGETRTLSISIYDEVQSFQMDAAGISSALLLGFSLIAIAAVQALARRGPRL